MKKYILFDHDGVLVDTEFWYYKAGQRALADVGVALDKEQYLRDMSQGLGTWTRARAAGVDEQTIARQREVRDAYYQEYLRTEAIEIEGVVVYNDFTKAQDFSRARYRINTVGGLEDLILTIT